MIAINKNNIPQCFQDFIDNEHPQKWDDIHHSRANPQVYETCRKYILEIEQHGISAYTECPLWNNANLHIDHFRKKGMNWPVNQTFRWENLFVDERNNNYGACYKDNNTSNKADYDSIIDPAQEDPEEYLTYVANGEMVPQSAISSAKKHKAQFTCDRFNLNHEALVSKRCQIISYINEYYKGGMSCQDIRSALKDSGFPTVIEYALKLNT